MLAVRKARKLPLFLRLFDWRGDNGFVAQCDYILHDAVGDLDGIALAFFGWFNHAASLPRRGGRAEKKIESSPLPIALFLYDELGVLCVGLPRLPQPQPNNLAPEVSD